MILLYHKVDVAAPNQWWVTVDTFFQQMRSLQSYEVVYLADYDPHNPRHVVITFDGVYSNVVRYAGPILQRFGYPFEAFVIGAHIGQDNAFDTGESERCTFASRAQLQTLAAQGGRIQWHTQTHCRLNTSDAQLLQREISKPAWLATLSPGSGHGAYFAYPHGDFSPAAAALVAQHYAGALACDAGDKADCYRWPRLTVTEQTPLFGSRVSVVIPNYNYGAYLPQAIESVLRQTVPPLEIIVADDASSDASLQAVAPYRDRVTLLTSPENLGIVGNFNRAVAACQGDYILLLGADNRMRADCIEQLQNALDNNPQAGIAYSDLMIFGPRARQLADKVGAQPFAHSLSENWPLLHWQFKEPSGQALADMLAGKHNLIHGSALYRKAAFTAVGGYQASDGPEDFHLFARMLKAGFAAVHVPQPLIDYRQHSAAQANSVLTLEMERAQWRALGQRRSAPSASPQAALQVSLLHMEVALQLRAKQQLTAQAEGLSQLALLCVRSLPPGEQRQGAEAAVTQCSQQLSAMPPAAAHSLLAAGLPLLAPGQSPHAMRTGEVGALPLFNDAWYCQANPDLRLPPHSGLAAQHYVERGFREGRDPHPLFDSDWYLWRYPEVQQMGVNPLLHYWLHGAQAGFMPNPFFDSAYYLQTYRDVAKSGDNPLGHYCQYGSGEGRSPSPLLDVAFYRGRYLAKEEAQTDPLAHFLWVGYAAGYLPASRAALPQQRAAG